MSLQRRFETIIIFITSILINSTKSQSSSSLLTSEAPYIGPKSCPDDPYIQGYHSLSSLNNDMIYNALQKSTSSSQSTYILCPHTQYSTIVPLIPIQNNTNIQCGIHGLSRDNCVFVGGGEGSSYHVYIPHDVVVKNVKLSGFIFTQALENERSVGAYANEFSSLSFIDCQWTENEASMLIEVFHRKISARRRIRAKQRQLFLQQTSNKKLSIKEEEKTIPTFQNLNLEKYMLNTRLLQKNPTIHDAYNNGMSVTFDQCSFFGNENAITILSTFKSNITLSNSLFLANNVTAVSVGIASYSTLTLRGTTFRMNANHFSTVFLDQTSTLNTYDEHSDSQYSFSMSGIGNTGHICQDVFLESDKGESDCLVNGGFSDNCYGECCDFNQVSCYNTLDSENSAADQKKEKTEMSALNTTGALLMGTSQVVVLGIFSNSSV